METQPDGRYHHPFMVDRLGLFELLAVDVEDDLRASTRVTEADGDEFDAPGFFGLDAKFDGGTDLTLTDTDTYDDSGMAASAQPGWRDGMTIDTRTDGETYDDDPGVERVSSPGRWLDTTQRTASDSDTYDEPGGLDALGVPSAWYSSTRYTFVDGETYDDSGASGLADPGCP